MIYKKEESDWVLEKKTIVCLFETLKLAEKYQVEAIADIINKKIISFQVTRGNVLALAAIAEYYNDFGQVCMEQCIHLMIWPNFKISHHFSGV